MCSVRVVPTPFLGLVLEPRLSELHSCGLLTRLSRGCQSQVYAAVLPQVLGGRLSQLAACAQSAAMSEENFKVVFLRHGESVWNVANIFTGWVRAISNTYSGRHYLSGRRTCWTLPRLPLASPHSKQLADSASFQKKHALEKLADFANFANPVAALRQACRVRLRRRFMLANVGSRCMSNCSKSAESENLELSDIGQNPLSVEDHFMSVVKPPQVRRHLSTASGHTRRRRRVALSHIMAWAGHRARVDFVTTPWLATMTTWLAAALFLVATPEVAACCRYLHRLRVVASLAPCLRHGPQPSWRERSWHMAPLMREELHRTKPIERRTFNAIAARMRVLWRDRARGLAQKHGDSMP